MVGVIRSISHIATHDTPGRNVPTARRCIILADARCSILAFAPFDFGMNLSSLLAVTPFHSCFFFLCSGREIKVNLWGHAAYRFNGAVIHSLGQDELTVVVFVGMTLHLHEGLLSLFLSATLLHCQLSPLF